VLPSILSAQIACIATSRVALLWVLGPSPPYREGVSSKNGWEKGRVMREIGILSKSVCASEIPTAPTWRANAELFLRVPESTSQRAERSGRRRRQSAADRGFGGKASDYDGHKRLRPHERSLIDSSCNAGKCADREYNEKEALRARGCS